MKLSGILAALDPGNITKRYRVCVWRHDENGTRGHNTCFWFFKNADVFANAVAGADNHIVLSDDWRDKVVWFKQGLLYRRPL